MALGQQEKSYASSYASPTTTVSDDSETLSGVTRRIDTLDSSVKAVYARLGTVVDTILGARAEQSGATARDAENKSYGVISYQNSRLSQTQDMMYEIERLVSRLEAGLIS